MDHLTVSQAAEALGITPRGVRRRIDRGAMAAVRVHPRLLMIPRAEVQTREGAVADEEGAHEPGGGADNSQHSREGRPQ